MTTTKTLKQRVKQVGIEVEGLWTELPPNPVIHDGSVRFNRMPDHTMGVGEVVSPPMAPDAIDRWLLENHPQHVNATCGLHVHMSFGSLLHYNMLMTPEFTPWMVNGLKEWATMNMEEGSDDRIRLIDRLMQPNHQYCAHKFAGDGQALQTKKDYQSRGTKHDRYTVINYAYRQYKTVECRVLPCLSTPQASAAAVHAVIGLTNRFLAAQRQVPRETESQLIVDSSTKIVKNIVQL